MAAPLDAERLFQALRDHEVDYVLIGGLGAVLHGSSAMTNDADIVPSSDPANLERLAAVLRSIDARLRIPDDPDGLAFDPHPALLASMAMLNTTTRFGDLDIAFSPPAMADYAALVRGSVLFDLAGCSVRVAALRDIIRSKETADRPKDRATLPLLRALEEEIEAG